MKLIATVEPFHKKLWYHGWAWVDYQYDLEITMPIPLNFIARYARLVWIFFGRRRKTFENLAYDSGVKYGMKLQQAKIDGYENSLRTFERTFSSVTQKPQDE